MEIRLPIPSLKMVLAVLAIGLLAATGFAVVEFQSERQLNRAFERLISAVEARDWKRVEAMTAADYADQWGMNRTQALEIGSEILRHFFVVEITISDVSLSVADRDPGEVHAVLRVSGNGTAIAQSVMAEANQLQNPFVFQWRKGSWKPWDWKLTSVSQSEVVFDGSMI
jgi:hypothetical protein